MPLLDARQLPTPAAPTAASEAVAAQTARRAARRIGRPPRSLHLPAGADERVLTYPAVPLLRGVLAALVGVGGQVVAVEHDHAPSARLRRRLDEAELTNVTVADDLPSAIGHKPFDRLLRLEPEPSIRRGRVAHAAAPGALLTAFVEHAPVTGGHLLACCRVTRRGGLTAREPAPGRIDDLGPAGLAATGLRHVAAAATGADGAAWWSSGPSLHTAQPPGLITTACGDGMLRVGLACHGGLALLDPAEPSAALWCAGLAGPLVEAFVQQVRRWRAAGRPAVRYRLRRATDGCRAHTELVPALFPADAAGRP